jgi:hypothetical protein
MFEIELPRMSGIRIITGSIEELNTRGSKVSRGIVLVMIR